MEQSIDESARLKDLSAALEIIRKAWVSVSRRSQSAWAFLCRVAWYLEQQQEEALSREFRE